MTSFYFLLAGLLLGLIIGIAHGLDMREHSHEIDLPSAYQLCAWQKTRLVRAESNRRVS